MEDMPIAAEAFFLTPTPTHSTIMDTSLNLDNAYTTGILDETPSIDIEIYKRLALVPQTNPDPLHLSAAVKALRDSDPAAQYLAKLHSVWKQRRAELSAQGRSLEDPAAKALFTSFKQAHEKALLQLIEGERQVRADPAGMRGHVTISPHLSALQIAQEKSADHKEGWRFPGGCLAANESEPPANSDPAKLFQSQALALKRDLADNTTAYAGFYPPASYVGEHIHHNGREETWIGIGGQRFQFAKERIRDGDYKYVTADEVDWDEVNACGGIGATDLVIVDEETAEKLRSMVWKGEGAGRRG